MGGGRRLFFFGNNNGWMAFLRWQKKHREVTRFFFCPPLGVGPCQKEVPEIGPAQKEFRKASPFSHPNHFSKTTLLPLTGALISPHEPMNWPNMTQI